MYIKISKTGEQLPPEATEWEAVLDTDTNLIWEVNISREQYKWDDIKIRVDVVNQAGLCGKKDWRVPKVDELKSLVKKGAIKPSIDTEFFPNTPVSCFWSSSPYADSSDYARSVYFGNGRGYYGNKGYMELVRLVRGSAKAQP